MKYSARSTAAAFLATISVGSLFTGCAPVVEKKDFLATDVVLEAEFGPSLRDAGITRISTPTIDDKDGRRPWYINPRAMVVGYIGAAGQPTRIGALSSQSHSAGITLDVGSSSLDFEADLPESLYVYAASESRTQVAADMILNAIAAVEHAKEQQRRWDARHAAAEKAIAARKVQN